MTAPSWYHSERGDANIRTLPKAFMRVHLSNCTLIAISNQPIPWQQLGACGPVDLVKLTCCKPGVRKRTPTRGQRSYFSDSECRKAVCVSRVEFIYGLRFSEWAGFSLATMSWLIEKDTTMRSHWEWQRWADDGSKWQLIHEPFAVTKEFCGAYLKKNAAPTEAQRVSWPKLRTVNWRFSSQKHGTTFLDDPKCAAHDHNIVLFWRYLPFNGEPRGAALRNPDMWRKETLSCSHVSVDLKSRHGVESMAQRIEALVNPGWPLSKGSVLKNPFSQVDFLSEFSWRGSSFSSVTGGKKNEMKPLKCKITLQCETTHK